jgi:hypothetical protein
MRAQAQRAVMAALAGMVGLVLWGMLFWGMLAEPLGVFHQLPNDTAVTELLVADDAPTGTYFMPWPRATAEQFAAFVAQHQAGPFYRLSYVREGVDPNSPGKLALGCLHYLAVAAVAVGLVLVSRAASFGRRFSLVTLGGLLGTLFITLGDPIWFHLPWDYTRGVLLYELVAWALLGSIVTWLAP